MRKLIGTVLLLLALPLVAGGGFEVSGMMGPPSLSWAIALSLGAHALVLSAGFVAAPKKGKIGLVRAIAITFFLIQTFALPPFVFALLYKRMANLELLEPNHLIWGLAQASSALAILSVAVKAWHVPIGRAKSG